MKLLFGFALSFCFTAFGLASGHQCYNCHDMPLDSNCRSPEYVTCNEKRDSQKYCATTTVVYEGKTHIGKSCVLKNEPKCKPGIAVTVNSPEVEGLKVTLLCCEGNLCNGSNKLYNGNFLFIAVLLGCIYGILV